jgi:hypothetical protein
VGSAGRHRRRALQGGGRRASPGRRTTCREKGERRRGKRERKGEVAAAALTEDGGELLRGGDGQPAGVVSFRVQMSLAVSAIWGEVGGGKRLQLYISGSLVPVHCIKRDQWINGPS